MIECVDNFPVVFDDFCRKHEVVYSLIYVICAYACLNKCARLCKNTCACVV